jgi:pilin isopeptide linkage protein
MPNDIISTDNSLDAAAAPGYTEPSWPGTAVSVSSLSQLNSAITAAGINPAIIELSSNITLNGTSVLIPEKAVIMLRSPAAAANVSVINAQKLSRVIENRGTLFLQDIKLINGDATIYSYSSDKYGGGVWSNTLNTRNNPTLLVIRDGTEITECKATGGGGVALSSGVTRLSTAYIEGGSIYNNTGGNGGGIYEYASLALVITGGSITGNKGSSGGGICVESSEWLSIRNADISSNTATNSGGGMYTTSLTNTIDIADSTFTNNTSNKDGGGIHTYSTIAIKEVNVTDNSATSNGGGISLWGGQLTMEESTIAQNTAGQNGGGIWSMSIGKEESNISSVNIISGDIFDNKAIDGGGVYNASYSTYNYPVYFNAEGGSIYNNTAQNNGGGVYLGSTVQADFEGDTSLYGNTAAVDGGAIWIPHASLENLKVGAKVSFDNNKASVSYNRNAADNPVYYANIKATQWTVPFEQGYNNYDISYSESNKVTPTINAEKHGLGGEIEDGKYSFSLYAADGTTLLGTAKNNVEGFVTFENLLSYDQPGTYNYIVKETTPSANGWASDTTEYPVQVTVTQASPTAGVDDLHAAVSYPDGFPNFTNTYTQDDKALVLFDCITFDEPGVYEYTVKEKTPSGNGWATDNREYPVVITVTDDGHGNLTSSAAYPDGFPEFLNTYNSDPTNVEITAVKLAIGKKLEGGDFEFGLFDENGSLVAVSQNDADGNILFPALSFDAVGNHQYTIKELTPSGNGWTVGGESWPVDVNVTDNAQGQLVADVEYPNGNAEFKNTYQAAPAIFCPSANKTAVGAPTTDGQFAFGVYDSQGNEVSSGTNLAASGIVTDAQGRRRLI